MRPQSTFQTLPTRRAEEKRDASSRFSLDVGTWTAPRREHVSISPAVMPLDNPGEQCYF
jgi:hypothetical protein